MDGLLGKVKELVSDEQVRSHASEPCHARAAQILIV